MRTVKELISELQKFPEDSICGAYEGEAVGISVKGSNGEYGFIFCNPYDIEEKETQLLNENRN